MEKDKKLGFFVLVSLVVGNMIGSGIFMIPRQMVEVSSPIVTILAWLAAGIGMVFVAFVFANLVMIRPDLTSGAQSYIGALFNNKKYGKYAGFIFAWSYWTANWSGNASIITSLTGYLSFFFPILTSTRKLHFIGSFQFVEGQLYSFLVSSLLLWGVVLILLTGFKKAGNLNLLTTVTKLIGFVLFILIALVTFQSIKFGAWYHPVEQAPTIGPILSNGFAAQFQQSILVTLWAFVGVESAIMFAGRAKSPRTIKYATIVGLLIALFVYIAISLLTLGLLPKEAIITSVRPLSDALDAVLPYGGLIIGLLAIISLVGSAVGWVMLSSETLYRSAENGIFLPYFKKTNSNQVPVRAIIATALATQICVVTTLLSSISSAYDFIVRLATLTFLYQYFIPSIYQLKLLFDKKTYRQISIWKKMMDGCVALIALGFSIWIIVCAIQDVKTLVLSVAMLFVGFVFYPLMKSKK